jgi:hypothetical protein
MNLFSAVTLADVTVIALWSLFYSLHFDNTSRCSTTGISNRSHPPGTVRDNGVYFRGSLSLEVAARPDELVLGRCSQFALVARYSQYLTGQTDVSA